MSSHTNGKHSRGLMGFMPKLDYNSFIRPIPTCHERRKYIDLFKTQLVTAAAGA